MHGVATGRDEAVRGEAIAGLQIDDFSEGLGCHAAQVLRVAVADAFHRDQRWRERNEFNLRIPCCSEGNQVACLSAGEGSGAHIPRARTREARRRST